MSRAPQSRARCVGFLQRDGRSVFDRQRVTVFEFRQHGHRRGQKPLRHYRQSAADRFVLGKRTEAEKRGRQNRRKTIRFQIPVATASQSESFRSRVERVRR